MRLWVVFVIAPRMYLAPYVHLSSDVLMLQGRGCEWVGCWIVWNISIPSSVDKSRRTAHLPSAADFYCGWMISAGDAFWGLRFWTIQSLCQLRCERVSEWSRLRHIRRQIPLDISFEVYSLMMMRSLFVFRGGVYSLTSLLIWFSTQSSWYDRIS